MKNLENYKIVTKKRSEIHFAEYNSNIRIIKDENYKALKRGIKKYGLVQPIIVNGRTGSIVGGNQKIKIADEIYRGNDYDINVALVDLDEKTEKELNIFLNNPSTQGEYNFYGLKELIEYNELDMNNMGFDEIDVAYLGLNEIFEETEAVDEARNAVNDIKTTNKNFKEKRKNVREKYLDENSPDNYIAVISQNVQEMDRLKEYLGMDEYGENIITVKSFMNILNRKFGVKGHSQDEIQ